MVGEGALVQPLLGFPHYVGVIIVGLIVITIVATAGICSHEDNVGVLMGSAASDNEC